MNGEENELSLNLRTTYALVVRAEVSTLREFLDELQGLARDYGVNIVYQKTSPGKLRVVPDMDGGD